LKPEGVLVVGQPGAGSGLIVEEVCQYFAPRGGCVVVDGDDLTWLHPEFAHLAETQLNLAATTVQPCVLELENSLRSAAVMARNHLVVVESRPRMADALKNLTQLRQAGYAVTIIAVLVRAEFSWDECQERPARQRRFLGIGLAVEREDHDEALSSVVTLLDALERTDFVDELSIVTIFGDLVASLSQSAGVPPGTVRRIFSDPAAAAAAAAAAANASVAQEEPPALENASVESAPVDLPDHWTSESSEDALARRRATKQEILIKTGRIKVAPGTDE
jgi:hypothetical protein